MTETVHSSNLIRGLLAVVALGAVLALASGCTEESLQEPVVTQDADDKGVVAPIQPVPVVPPPVVQVAFLENLIAGGQLTQSDVYIVHYFDDAYITPLSQPSKAAMYAFLDEVELLGILAYEFEARWDELYTPTTPAYQAFADELEALLDFTCAGKDGGATIIAGAALIGGAIGCVGKAEACMDDSLDNQTACFRQQCPVGEKPDIDCCTDEAKEDISNCAWTCGLNGPDPEYNSNCCKPDQTCLKCHIRPIGQHYGYQPNNKSRPRGDCVR